jgi:hypothetical protein
MRTSLALSAAVAVIAATPAMAQRATTATLDLNAMGLRYGDSVSSGGLSVSPTLSVVAGRTSLEAGGTVSKFQSGVSVQGTLGLSAFTPSWKSFSIEAAGSAGGSSHEDGYRTGQTRAAGRLHYMRNRGGLWAGGGAGTMWDGFEWRRVEEMEAGAWIARGRSQFVVSTTPAIVDDTIRYTDTQAGVTWKTPRAELGATAGFRSGSRLPSTPGEASVWGGISIAIPVASRASVVASGGTYPLDFTQGFPAGRYVSIGMRFSAAPSTVSSAPMPGVPASGITRFDVRRLDDTRIVIELRAPSAHSVEITGDVTQWDPQPFHSEGNGRFSIELPVTAGTSEINVRVDGGAWTVPPGLTVVKDEFGTPVGILVVPDR